LAKISPSPHFTTIKSIYRKCKTYKKLIRIYKNYKKPQKYQKNAKKGHFGEKGAIPMTHQDPDFSGFLPFFRFFSNKKSYPALHGKFQQFPLKTTI
jgi:hypothetical protein